MDMLNIKMLKDNGRTVIIIDGADRARDEAAYHIINAYIGTQDVPDPAPASLAGPNTGATESLQENSGGDLVAQKPSVLHKEKVIEAPPFQEVIGLSPAPAPKQEMPTEDAIGRMEDYALARQRGTDIISRGTYAGMTPISALTQYNDFALAELFSIASTMSACDEKAEIIRACKQHMASLPETGNNLYTTRDEKIQFIKNMANMTPIETFINGYVGLNEFCLAANDAEINNAFSGIIWSLADRGGRPL